MYREKLMELGFNPHFKGFEYINFMLENYVPMITLTELYKMAAEKYQSSDNVIMVTTLRTFRHNQGFSDMKLNEFISKYKIIFDSELKKENDEDKKWVKKY